MQCITANLCSLWKRALRVDEIRAKSREWTAELFVPPAEELYRVSARIGNLSQPAIKITSLWREKPKFLSLPPPAKPCEITILRCCAIKRHRPRLLFAAISRPGMLTRGAAGVCTASSSSSCRFQPPAPLHPPGPWRSKRRRSPSIPGVSQAGA